MKDKNLYIIEWLVFADEDYATAKDLLKNDNVYARSICFHCQQAAEKYLKALIIKNDLPIIKTHNLAVLVGQIKEVDKSVVEIETLAVALSEYAVTVRYPDDFEKISDDEAISAFEKATEIKKFIELKLRD